jgi:hypothetical protein
MKILFFLLLSFLIINSKANSQRGGSSLGGEVLITREQNSVDKTFKDFSQYSPANFLNGSVLMGFNNSENTKGRRYIFDSWVKGSILTSEGKTVDNQRFLFNLDKVTNRLLVTQDKTNIVEVDKTAIRSLSLNNGTETIVLERIDLVNPQVFLRLLTKKDNGYSLYKSTKTKLVRANYTTNGIVESGNPYDEYVDEDQYYVLSASEKGFKTFNLWPKSIKTALKGNDKKLNEYFYNHAGENVDELFVKGLIEEINR